MEKEAGRKKFLQKKSKTDQGSSLPANASAAGSPVLCFDIDCEARLEFHCEVVGKDGDLLDELFYQSFVELCNVGFLSGDEVLQLGDAFLCLLAVTCVCLGL